MSFLFFHKSNVKTDNIENAYKSIEDIITIATEAVKYLENKGSYTHKDLESLLSKKITISKVGKGAIAVLKRLPVVSLFG